MAQKFRDYCFTLNNYTEEEFLKIQNLPHSYLVIGKEIGKEGTPHLQGYIEFPNQRSFKAVAKLIKRWHIEKRQGTGQQASDYCKKEGDFIEVGKIKKQGERKDLDDIKEEIMKGKKVDEIVIENPNYFHMYGRTLTKIEDIALRKKFRSKMTEGIWYWGPTGVGKSHKAFEGFDPDTHYLWKYDKDWQDGYTGQSIVIINEFRGQITFAEMLALIDKWPHFVSRRGREPAPFLADKVIITSSKPPEEVYINCNDKMDQLLRRISVIKLDDSWKLAQKCSGG